MSETVAFEVAVIGAGPAGLSAAVAAARAGRRVLLIDGGPRPGGQYWRHRQGDDGRHHHDWQEFLRLEAGLTEHRDLIDYRPGHLVWQVERAGGPGASADAGFVIHAMTQGPDRRPREVELQAKALVIATGAYDRQLPFPGWTLPGVITAGGVQALLKGQGVVAGKRIAVAGTGPFLLAVAAGLAEAGATVVGVFEANRPASMARHPIAFLRNASKLGEAAGFMAAMARYRIPFQMRSAVVAAHGEGALERITVASIDEQWRPVPSQRWTGTGQQSGRQTIECDTLAVGYGFTPQLELPVQLGCATRADIDGSLVVKVDATQASSVPGVWVAGETCGIGGAALAVTEGEIAGLYASTVTGGGAATDAKAIADLRGKRSAQRSFIRAMHEAWGVKPGWMTWLDPSTIVCRCEEVTAERLRRSVGELGAIDARSSKLLTRPGMGLCQGRVCGWAASSLVANELGRTLSEDDLRAMAGRPITMPVPLGLLAAGVSTAASAGSTEGSTSEEGVR